MSVLEALHQQHKRINQNIARKAYKPPVQEPAKLPALTFTSVATPADERAWACEIEGFVPDRMPTLRQIRDAVCTFYSIGVLDFLGCRRFERLAYARHVAYYLGAKLTLKSLPEIGRRFGGKDHTSVLHGVRRIARLAKDDAVLRESIEILVDRLGGFDVSNQRVPKTVLNPDAVRFIRASHRSIRSLAAEFNVTPSAINAVRRGWSWKNVK